MVGSYDICLGGEKIGDAWISREGLYYRFRARCRLTGEIMFTLAVTDGEKTHDLGHLVPEKGIFCLNKRLPAKRFTGNGVSFRLVSDHERGKGRFVPIRAEEPFAYLHRLQGAYLEIRDGVTGIVVQEDQRSSCKETGQ